MPHFALASELDRLTPDQIAQVDHIIIDDGDWSPEQISHYIARWYPNTALTPDLRPDDWTNARGDNLP